MAKWQGTVVPNSGYVEKVYFNNKLSADEVYNILSQLTYIETPFLTYPVYPILFANDGNPVMFVAKYIGSVSNLTYYDIFLSTDITNPETAVTILNMDSSNDILIVEFNNTEYTINKEVINDYSGLPIGIQNDLISSLVSSTPFTQSQQTIADKLQKSVNGKQYVIDKTNAKAGTSLPINCTWEELGDTIEGISGSGSGAINVPSVSNLTVNEDGEASWDEPDFTELEDFDYTYIYIVKVNGKEIETTDTSKDITSYLVEGTNIVSVVVKVTVTTIKNGKEINETIEFSFPAYTLVTLGATLPTVKEKMVSATIGTNVYIFGGIDNTGSHTTTIYKFDTTTETITTLDTTLPTANSGMASAVIGTNVYIFGGNSSTGRTNTIVKFIE